MSRIWTRALPLTAAALIVTIVACRDDALFGPRRSIPLVPTARSPQSASAPDNQTTNFNTRSPSTGATQLPSTFGIRLKYATVYAVKIYDYMKQVPFNANAGLPAQDPVPISGTFSWNWATGYVNQAYSGAAAGPVDFYVSFNKNDSISGATRTGASATYSTTGTYANGTPWWCGPAYNATPCYTYEGDPGYVQLRRLDADVALTSDSSQVNTGTNVTFTITSAPRYVEGQEMPITIDTVSWIIDPDTLGGDFSDEQLLNACSFSGGPSLKTCT